MSFLMAQMSIMTRHLSLLTVQTSRLRALPSIVCASDSEFKLDSIIRTFASKAKKDKKKSGSVGDVEKGEGSALQHQEWVKFQQSIKVEGFETGQTTTLQSTKKTRGGKAVQKKKTKRDVMAEKLQERRRLTGAGGGEFPPLRYSDDETERLLAQAYAALPPRAGKRGTKNLKRQKRRWHLVREIHRKYKAHMANFQIRKMKKRQLKVRDVKAILAVAPEICTSDREYQMSVYQRWAATMVIDQDSAVVAKTGYGPQPPTEETGQNQQSTT